MCTNDSPNLTSNVIVEKLLNLKLHVEMLLPNSKVYLSQPIIREDDMKARLTIKHVIDKLDSLGIEVMDNRNITNDMLGVKGLHLSGRGIGRLAMNIISFIKKK